MRALHHVHSNADLSDRLQALRNFVAAKCSLSSLTHRSLQSHRVQLGKLRPAFAICHFLPSLTSALPGKPSLSSSVFIRILVPRHWARRYRNICGRQIRCILFAHIACFVFLRCFKMLLGPFGGSVPSQNSANYSSKLPVGIWRGLGAQPTPLFYGWPRTSR